MELRDFIVTPIIIIMVYATAYLLRPLVTDALNRKYFFPALTVRIMGAIAVGFIYQFYYSGGDTFNYHTHGSRHIWEAMMHAPSDGMVLLFGNMYDLQSVYEYASKIYFLRDPGSLFVIRITAVLDMITFSAYSGTAVLFAAMSFAGSWAFFLTFYRRYPHLMFQLALVIFFVPSLVFWGSGILKDTVILAALGFATYFIDRLIIQRKWSFFAFLYLVVSLYVIFEIRKFILQAFIPAALLWLFYKYLMAIRSTAIRILIFPAIICLVGYLGFLVVVKVGEGDKRYALGNLAKTAKITAYDIGFYTGRDAGSGYSLGELDGTFGNMIQKAPSALVVTFFRPFLWEVKNPLMLLAGIESLGFTILVAYILLTKRSPMARNARNPDVVFLTTFSVAMAFAVGITSYNFGTLSRYKVPLLPFFLTAAVIIKSRDEESDWTGALTNEPSAVTNQAGR